MLRWKLSPLILSFLWPVLLSPSLMAQTKRTYTFDSHELFITPNSTCSTAGALYKITSTRNRETIALDSTKFNCPNRSLANGTIELDYPAAATGTLNANGELVLDTPATFSLRATGQWTYAIDNAGNRIDGSLQIGFGVIPDCAQ